MAEQKREVTFTGEQLMNAYRSEESKMLAFQKKAQQLQAILFEINIAEEAVKEINKSGKNEKIIVDLGAGVYTEATLDSNEKFKTALAGSILQNSDSKSTLELLAKRKEVLQKDMATIEKEQEKTATALNEISSILQAGEMQARKLAMQEQKAKTA